MTLMSRPMLATHKSLANDMVSPKKQTRFFNVFKMT